MCQRKKEAAEKKNVGARGDFAGDFVTHISTPRHLTTTTQCVSKVCEVAPIAGSTAESGSVDSQLPALRPTGMRTVSENNHDSLSVC